MEPLLSIHDLQLSVYPGRKTVVDVSELSIAQGETLALIGETGSGKTLTALSILRLYPSKTIRVERGSIIYNGENILAYDKAHINALRGREIAMIFQDPMSSLNPVFTVGTVIVEIIRTHFKLSKKEARLKACEAFADSGFTEPDEILGRYPHELSGGQRQRVCIAMAAACEPKLLIADEPTTALDVTIQTQILALIKKLKKEKGLSILFITHNLGIVANIADHIAVMRNGRVVETGSVEKVLARPEHPYTRMLLDAIPRPDETRRRLPIIDYQI